MHYLSSNFNLLSSNINWNLLKHKKKITIDDKYNNILLSLNNNKILSDINTFHIIFYIDKNNLIVFKSIFKEIKKKNYI